MNEFDLIIHYDRIGESDMYNCHTVGKLVRCKDCKYWRRFAKEDADGGCSLLEINEGRKPNDYCSQAERNDEVEE